MKQLAFVALVALVFTSPHALGCKVDQPAPSNVLPAQAPATSSAPAAPRGPDLQGFSADGLARLTATLRARVEAGRMPGGVMLLARNGQVVLEEAFGVLDPKGATPAPMPKDAIFRVYSMTKPIVSAGVMMLVEEGKVQLTDLAAKYFPELKELKVGVEKPGPGGKPVLELVPAQREMTVQDLLRHTSGLTYGIFGKSLVKDEYLKNKVDARDITNEELIKRLATVPLHYQPGTTWEYSRSTDVLGALIERVSGEPLDAYLDRRILKPLQMKDSGFWVPQDKQSRIAEPFALDPDTKQPVSVSDVRQRPSFLSGGGGMVATARDYLRFAQAMLDGGVLDGARILSPHTVRFMTSDHLGGIRGPNYGPGPGYGFGLGFAVRTAQGQAPTAGSVGEFTWGGLAGTAFWVDPRERVIAIWMMQAPGARNEMRTLLRTLVYGALVAESATDTRAIEATQL